MKKFLRFFITKPVAVCLAALLIVCAGLYGIFACRTVLLPDNGICELAVTITMEGADAQTVKENVSDKVQQSLYSLEKAESVTAISFDGRSEVKIRFYGRDYDSCVAAVTSRLSALSLPAGASLPAVSSTDSAVAEIAVTRADGDFALLSRISAQFCDALYNITGVTKGELAGSGEQLCYYNGSRALIVRVYADRGADKTAVSKNVTALAEKFEAKGLQFFAVYDYTAAVRASALSRGLCLFFGVLLCLGALLLCLKDARAVFAAACCMAVSVTASIALLCLFNQSISALTVAGLAAGCIFAAMSGAISAGAISARSRLGENPFAASVKGTPVGSVLSGCAMLVCALLPLLASGAISAAFALSALLCSVISAIASLTLTPCVYCLLCGGTKYFLKGDPLKKEVATVPPPPDVKNVTAQPLKIQQQRETKLKEELRDERSLDDYIIPSLSDISKLNKKARRALKVKRFAADKPLETLRKGYVFLLNGALKRKFAAAAVAVCLFLASAATLFCTGVEALPAVECSLLSIDLTPPSSQLSRQQTSQYAIRAAKTLSESMTGVKGVTLEIRDGQDGSLVSAHISVTLEHKTRTEQSAEQARGLLFNDSGWQVAVSVKNAAAFPDSGLDGISVSVYGESMGQLKEIYAEIESSLLRLSGFRSVKNDFNGSGIPFSEGKYVMKIIAQTHGLDAGAAVDKLQSVTANVLAGYDSCYYRTGNVQRAVSDVYGNLFTALAVAVVLLYIVAAAKTGSLLKGLAVAAAIPFAATGCLIAIAVCSLPLSAPVVLGIIFSCAFAAQFGLSIVTKTEKHVCDGMPCGNAAVAGSAAALKGVLCGILVAVGMMLPFALGAGSGGKLLMPLGAALLGGVVLGGAALLFTVPIVYCLIKKASPAAAVDEAPVYDLEDTDIEIEIEPADKTTPGSETQPSDDSPSLPPPPDKIFL